MKIIGNKILIFEMKQEFTKYLKEGIYIQCMFLLKDISFSNDFQYRTIRSFYLGMPKLCTTVVDRIIMVSLWEYSSIKDLLMAKVALFIP